MVSQYTNALRASQGACVTAELLTTRGGFSKSMSDLGLFANAHRKEDKG